MRLCLSPSSEFPSASAGTQPAKRTTKAGRNLATRFFFCLHQFNPKHWRKKEGESCPQTDRQAGRWGWGGGVKGFTKGKIESRHVYLRFRRFGQNITFHYSWLTLGSRGSKGRRKSVFVLLLGLGSGFIPSNLLSLQSSNHNRNVGKIIPCITATTIVMMIILSRLQQSYKGGVCFCSSVYYKDVHSFSLWLHCFSTSASSVSIVVVM